jgi:hypothetical protein
MKVKHKYIKTTKLSEGIGLSRGALSQKADGGNYQRLTPENIERLKREFFDLHLELFEILTIEEYDIVQEAQRNYTIEKFNS